MNNYTMNNYTMNNDTMNNTMNSTMNSTMTERILSVINDNNTTIDNIDWLHPNVLKTIDNDIEKARRKRKESCNELKMKGFNDPQYYIDKLGKLANEYDFKFDGNKYNIKGIILIILYYIIL